MYVSITGNKGNQDVYIKQSYRKENGKTSSRIYKKLGKYNDLLAQFSGDEAAMMDWVKKEAEKETLLYNQRREKVTVSFSPLARIPLDEERLFNVGYLFLQQLCTELMFGSICRNIRNHHRFTYDFHAILTDLIYARILSPSSKLSSFSYCQSLLEPPKYSQQNLYRSLSVLAEESDYIQEELYQNSNFVHPRNSKILYYDCTNYYFEIEAEDGMKKYGKSKEHRPNPIVTMKLDTGRRSALFERSDEGIELKGVFAKLKISDELSETLTLLSYLGITYRKNEVIKDILNWFGYGIDFLNYGNPIQELRMAIANSDDVKSLVLDMIQEMDLDIVNFRVEEMENERIEVYTKHIVDGYESELNLSDESSGTKKLFELLPFIADGLASGTTLVIDELDAKIHPVLLRHIIMMFNDMEINRHGAQLIFTSHDLSTMNSEVFRRDEIWFVAKGNRQNSKLYSLVEFKNDKGESVRKDAKFDKQYLEGKYGADPYLRKIIDWGKVNA